jgi:hypothetical protein
MDREKKLKELIYLKGVVIKEAKKEIKEYRKQLDMLNGNSKVKKKRK